MRQSQERAESATTSNLCFRVPEQLNLRLDAEVLRRRRQSGRRISRASLLVEILDGNLPELPALFDLATHAGG